VLFFSFSHDKQDLYILPILPAVAALAAGAIVHASGASRLVRTTSTALGLLLMLAGGAVLYAVGDGEGPYALAGALTVGWLALAAGSTATALALKRQPLAAVIAASIGLTAVNWTLVMRVLPDLERLKPAPTLVETLRPRLASGDVLSTYGVALPSMVYYLRRPVNVYYAPEPFVADVLGSTRMFGVLFESDFAGMRDRVSSGTCVVRRVPAFEVKLRHVLARTPPRNLVLITNDCRF
jgi:4-amino-4-deoxy-L-arabinose transferase-like glycosyltransferase